MYVLQRDFRISANEALHVRPVWEIDNLLEHHRAVAQAAQDQLLAEEHARNVQATRGH